MAINAAALYKNTSIQTASPAELTLMLYEGAIKFANRAIIAMEKNDIQGANINLIKTQRIIGELRAVLDHKYPVAKDFENVYNLIYDLLVQANIKKDIDMAERALGYIREMRDTWKQVMEITNKTAR